MVLITHPVAGDSKQIPLPRSARQQPNARTLSQVGAVAVPSKGRSPTAVRFATIATGLTQLSNAGIPLRVIQEISGHNNLEQLQKYLEVKPEQVRGAVAALSMLSHAGKGGEFATGS